MPMGYWNRAGHTTNTSQHSPLLLSFAHVNSSPSSPNPQSCQAVVKYLDENAKSELAAGAIRPMALMKLPEEVGV